MAKVFCGRAPPSEVRIRDDRAIVLDDKSARSTNRTVFCLMNRTGGKAVDETTDE